MKNKFKVRIFKCEEMYRIEYTYYKIIPHWHIIYDFIDLGSNNYLSGYIPFLFKYEDAIKFAQKIKSIDDVLKLQIIAKQTHDEWMEKRREWLLKNTPVRSEVIVNK